AVTAGVDHADGGRAVAADVDLPAVRGDHEPVRALRDRDGADDRVLGRVDHRYRIVLEQPHVYLWGGRHHARARPEQPPPRQGRDPHRRRHALAHAGLPGDFEFSVAVNWIPDMDRG